KISDKVLPATFDKCAESVAKKPIFRDTFRARRHIYTGGRLAPPCLPPALGCRGGQEGGGGVLSRRSSSAGLTKCHECMPVILDPKEIDAWLDRSPGSEAAQVWT